MKGITPHAWLRRVSDYHSGGVSAAERAAVEAHLATCAECRQALAIYQRFYTLARSPLRLGDGGKGALAGYRPVVLEEIMIGTDRDPHTGTTPTRRGRARGTLTTLGAIAAVLLIAVLAAALFAHFRAPTQPATPHPHLTPTPALDAQSQAYVNLLRTYYVPLAEAFLQEGACVYAVDAPRGGRPADIATCQAPSQAELAAAQALSTHLASATPPARWQAQHAALQEITQAVIAVATKRLQAIAAHSRTQFLAAGQEPADMICGPIVEINVGPPRLSPSLPYLDPNLCAQTSGLR